MNNKTILVTGGAGFIGSNLVDRLIAQKYKVVVIDNFSNGKKENIAYHKDNPMFKLYNMSICDDMDKVFATEKPDSICHLAAIARVPFSIKEPQKTNDTNINGTLNMLVHAKRYGVKRFINYGSSSEYGDPPTRPFMEDMNMYPLSPYGLQKLAGDHYARLYYYLHGMQTITLRPFNVFGPRMNYEGAYALLIAKAHQWVFTGAKFKINGDGLQTRDFTYVDDMVEATVKSLTTENEKAFGESFNIGASNAKVVNDVVNKIISLSGKSLKPEHGPALPEPRNTLADISKAKKMLDWSPKANFDRALEKTYKYFEKLFANLI